MTGLCKAGEPAAAAGADQRAQQAAEVAAAVAAVHQGEGKEGQA